MSSFLPLAFISIVLSMGKLAFSCSLWITSLCPRHGDTSRKVSLQTPKDFLMASLHYWAFGLFVHCIQYPNDTGQEDYIRLGCDSKTMPLLAGPFNMAGRVHQVVH